MCPVWPAALEATVSEHCSFPEMPSGYPEVSIEEDSEWSVQVVPRALPTISLFQASPWWRETETEEPSSDELRSSPADTDLQTQPLMTLRQKDDEVKAT